MRRSLQGVAPRGARHLASSRARRQARSPALPARNRRTQATVPPPASAIQVLLSRRHEAPNRTSASRLRALGVPYWHRAPQPVDGWRRALRWDSPQLLQLWTSSSRRASEDLLPIAACCQKLRLASILLCPPNTALSCEGRGSLTNADLVSFNA